MIPDLPRVTRGRPLVSAIVLNRNGALLLNAFFESLRAYNTWNRLEIVVIDHASSDNSLEVVRRWAQLLPVEAVARETNESFACANNRAAEWARGEMLLLANNDIVLLEDVIPRMVAAVDATGGLVGVRQFQNEPNNAESPRRWHHIGVRHSWNTRQRCIVPYNAAPVPGDEALAISACRMSAVTGSLVMCRRADYLAVGGMCEDYFYGFEDVDLCCKFHFRLNRPVICLNDLSALHGASTTRRRTMSRGQRRAVYRSNIRTLESRYGFAMWRDLNTAWLEDDGSLRGLAPGLAVLGSTISPALEAALGVFARGGWSISRSDHARSLDLSGVDVVVLADPAIRLDRLRRRDILLCRVAWACDAIEAWTARSDLSAFDLAVAADAAAAEALQRAGVPAILPSAAVGPGQALLSALVERRRDSFRFAIVVTARDEQAQAQRVVRALAAAAQTAWLAREGESWDIDPADVVVTTAVAAPELRSRLVLPFPGEADPGRAAQILLTAARQAAKALAPGPLDPALPDRYGTALMP